MAGDPLLVAGVAAGAVDADAYSTWLAVVYQVARALGGAVVGQAEHPAPGRNHYRVRIRSAAGTRVGVLLNGAGRLGGAPGDPGPRGGAFCLPRGATPKLVPFGALPVAARGD